jgi:hypothetical protein
MKRAYGGSPLCGRESASCSKRVRVDDPTSKDLEEKK